MNSIARWPTMQLHSLHLTTGFNAFEYQADVLSKILAVCPHLRMLVVQAQILTICLEQKQKIYLPSLTHLHFYASYSEHMPDIQLLASAFPNMCYFSSDTNFLGHGWKSVELILKLIEMFPHLHHLHTGVFRYWYEEEPQRKLEVSVMNILKSSEQLRSINCSVTIYEYQYLRIWL